MIYVINTSKLDLSKAKAKWSPILQKLKISSKLEEQIAYYCEMHTNTEVQSTETIHFNKNLQIASTLPPSLKILSLLNLKGKNLQLTEKNVFQYLNDKGDIQCGEICTLSQSIPLIYNKEKSSYNTDETLIILTEQLARIINQQLEEYNTIVLYKMVDSISYRINEHSEDDNMTIICRYSLYDPKEIVTKTENTLGFFSNDQLLAELAKRLVNIKDTFRELETVIF